MKSDVLASILDGVKGARKDGGAWLFDEAVSGTLFAGGGGEIITVPRIHRVELAKEYCAVTTVKSERFFFPYELLIGLKIEQSEERSKVPTGSAGFR
jgi:hypothetical protein